ncbi:MAG: N-methyl-L-tryptophan oxidase [Alphaproteobacteria bacterium]|nr:N-methyl-L-tryptophan oxidase [Alphaproteobacteria bacterium]
MKYDLAIVGIGSHGSAALHRAAQEGLKVIGIDRFDPPHTRGSHHGDTRITREAQFEGDHLVKIVQAGNKWRESFEDKNDPLFVKCGCLNIGVKNSDTVRDIAAAASGVAQRCNIEIETLDAATLAKRFPVFQVPDNFDVVFEPNAGYLRPEACIAKNIEMARQYGAKVLVNTEVTDIAEGRITLADGRVIEAEQIIISAGAYIKKFVPATFAQKIKPVRMYVGWFKIKENYEAHKNAPVFCLDYNDYGIYGFPAIDGPDGGMKVGVEIDVFNKPALDLATHTYETTKEEMDEIFAGVLEYLPALSYDYVRSAACIYTVVTDDEFIIDKHPLMKGVWICSACSGHGFKLSFGIGMMLVDLVKTGKSALYTDKFKFSRFN